MADKKASDKVFIGKTNFRGAERIFGIKAADRRMHMYVIGKTGTGKTTLLENIVLQDIRAGRGICVIDPHGEFVEQHVLPQIPPERINDVVYVNPVDTEYPIGFNILEVPDLKYKHLVVSDLLGIFTKIWANVWSARMEYILQNCIMALLDTPGTTLLGIPRLLVDKDYRQKIIANIKDPVVKSFWIHEYEQWRDQFRNEAIVPIQNKVNQFLNTSFIRNIVGQPTSTLNIPELMNSKKILLVNVSKGKVGEDNSALLGAMIITKIQLAAMERVRIPEEDRVDFYLYVDEFQNFATDSFASILSEARKYALNITIAHQYIGQLETDVSTKVRDAVFGNVGTMISFRVGATDAEFLEKEYEPEFMIQDLINLPNHHIYLKLMVDGVTSRPFSATTLPPLRFESDESLKERIIKVSRERYARPRAEVEEKIAKWSGIVSGGEAMGEVEGKFFESTCWNCGKTATTPFKPDGKRPVYCLSCLKQIEEGKLVPLPERMPRVGQNKYAATLGEIGIEFKMEGSVRSAPVTADRRSPVPTFRNDRTSPVRSQPRRDVGTADAFSHRTSNGMNPSRPQLSQTRRESGQIRQEQSRTQVSERRPPVSPMSRSRPIVRTPQGTKPVSLTELKSKTESDREDIKHYESFRKPALSPRSAVDVPGLRSALAEALNPVRNQTPQASADAQAHRISNGVKDRKEEVVQKKDTEEKKVIRPGETVKF